MEYETWSRNNESKGLWIIDNIKKSKAIFVILTKNVVQGIYTQNWIGFEIGVAFAFKPKIPIIVFKEDIDFPIPYLSHYLSYPISKHETTNNNITNNLIGFINKLISEGIDYFFRYIIKNDNINIPKALSI